MPEAITFIGPHPIEFVFDGERVFLRIESDDSVRVIHMADDENAAAQPPTAVMKEAEWNLLEFPSDPRYVYVDASAPGDGDGSKEAPYNSIQLACDMAANAGDVLLLAVGKYHEHNIDIDGKIIFILGGHDPDTWERTGGPQDTVLDGDGTDRVFSVYERASPAS